MVIPWTAAGLFRFAADAIVVLHVAYVSFVILGQLAALLGRLCRWNWVHNPWFRLTHLAAILIVVVEAWCGIVCPLTTLEADLRRRAGDVHYQGDFIGHWAHECLFVEADPWVFTLAYSLFGLIVCAGLWLVPIRFRGRPADSIS
jgi:hypothetical protein